MKAHKITSGRNIMPQNCIELLQKCELCFLNNLIGEPKYVHFKSFKYFVLFFLLKRQRSRYLIHHKQYVYSAKHNIKFKVMQAMALSFGII